MIPTTYSLGKALKEARERCGLSVIQVGKALCRSRAVIYRWEGDVTVPDALEVYELAQLYGLTVDNLMNVHGNLIPEGAQSISEWARTLGMSRQRLSYQYRVGHLKGIPVDKVVYIPRDEMMKYLSSKKIQTLTDSEE